MESLSDDCKSRIGVGGTFPVPSPQKRLRGNRYVAVSLRRILQSLLRSDKQDSDEEGPGHPFVEVSGRVQLVLPSDEEHLPTGELQEERNQ